MYRYVPEILAYTDKLLIMHILFKISIILNATSEI